MKKLIKHHIMKYSKITPRTLFAIISLAFAVLIIIFDNPFLEFLSLFCYSVWLLLYYETKKDKLIQ